MIIKYFIGKAELQKLFESFTTMIFIIFVNSLMGLTITQAQASPTTSGLSGSGSGISPTNYSCQPTSRQQCSGISDGSNIYSSIATLATDNSLDLTGYECVLIENNIGELRSQTDISCVINSLERNTIVILHSTDSSNPFEAHSIARIKKNTWILGVTDFNPDYSNCPTQEECSHVIINAPGNFDGRHWLEIGDSHHRAVDIGKSGVENIDFRAPVNQTHDNIDSIIFSRCIKGEFSISSSRFYLDRRASIYYQCLSDVSGNHSRLIMSDVKIFGVNENPNSPPTNTPDSFKTLEGIYIDLPRTQDNSNAIDLSNITCRGDIDVCFEVLVGSNSTVKMRKLHIGENNNIDSVNKGIQLNKCNVGECRNLSNATYSLSDSTIFAKTSIELYGELNFTFNENTLNGDKPLVQVTQGAGSTIHFSERSMRNYWQNPMVSPCSFIENYTGEPDFSGFPCGNDNMIFTSVSTSFTESTILPEETRIPGAIIPSAHKEDVALIAVATVPSSVIIVATATGIVAVLAYIIIRYHHHKNKNMVPPTQ